MSNYPAVAILLQTVSGVLYTGFVSQRSYGYALSREPLSNTTGNRLSKTERKAG